MATAVAGELAPGSSQMVSWFTYHVLFCDARQVGLRALASAAAGDLSHLSALLAAAPAEDGRSTMLAVLATASPAALAALAASPDCLGAWRSAGRACLITSPCFPACVLLANPLWFFKGLFWWRLHHDDGDPLWWLCWPPPRPPAALAALAVLRNCLGARLWAASRATCIFLAC